jgi:hypothetical protein
MQRMCAACCGAAVSRLTSGWLPRLPLWECIAVTDSSPLCASCFHPPPTHPPRISTRVHVSLRQLEVWLKVGRVIREIRSAFVRGNLAQMSSIIAAQSADPVFGPLLNAAASRELKCFVGFMENREVRGRLGAGGSFAVGELEVWDGVGWVGDPC